MNLLLPILLSTLILLSCSSHKLQQISPSPPPVHTPEFATSLAHTGKTPWTTGNRITTLNNGEEFFPAMLRAVERAEKSITFESFITTYSWPVHNFSQAFIDAAERGVHVHLILDAFGSRHYGDEYLETMRSVGIEIEWYSPFSLLRPYRYNHRTHRRILVVDGIIGFTGGAGWSELWQGHAQDPDHWADTQYELRGPVVRQLQENFNDNWEELTGSPLSGPSYFPPLSTQGVLRSQMVLGSPEKQEDTIGSTTLLAIRAARKSIHLSHSYFLPNKEITAALVDALRRGVRVEIIVPGKHTDMPIARLVSMSSLQRLHRAGARIYEYLPTMMHRKILVIDQHLTIAGSGNIDPRSFFINDENNLHVLGPSFAMTQIDLFESDKARCKLLTTSDLRLHAHQWPAAAFGKLIEGQL